MTRRRIIVWTIILTWRLGRCCRFWSIGNGFPVLVTWTLSSVVDAGRTVASIFWCEFHLYILADRFGNQSERFKAIILKTFEIELSDKAGCFKGSIWFISPTYFRNFASDQWLYGLAILICRL